MSQSHPTLMQYFKEAHGGKTAITRLASSPRGEILLAYTAGASRLAF